MIRTILFAVLLAATACGQAFAQDDAGTAPDSRAWEFEVFLGEKPIGAHSFVMAADPGGYQMQIEAKLRVKFLFITAYRYEHSNRELWRDGCLQQIESQTDDSGEAYAVSGRRVDDAFEVVANGQMDRLPGCITTFAYWDPRFLEQSALLNSQTGEYMPMEIEGPVADRRDLRGKPISALRYRLKGKDVDISLWYTEQGDWIALESVLEGGRILRYQRL